MIRLRSFVILSSVLVVCLAMAASWIQLKSLLEQGALTLEEKELDHISQIVRAAIETKESELTNYTQIIRNNNDLSSAYLIARESGDAELVDAKLKKIKNEIHYDFSEILSLEGKPLHSNGSDLEPEMVRRVLAEKEGLFPGRLNGKLALISFSTLTLYDEPIAIFVMGCFPEGELKKELSGLSNADVDFNITGPPDTSASRVADPAHGRLSFRIKGTGSDGFWATINLKENPAASFWRLFSTRLLLSGAASLTLLLVLLYCFLELGFMRGFRNFVEEVKKVSQDVDRGVPRELPVTPSRIFENNLLFQATQKLVRSLIAHEERMKKQVMLQEAVEKQRALISLAAQVAHDIRSPLSALTVALDDVSGLEERNRTLVRSATARIHDIASSLLERQHSFSGPGEIDNGSGARDTVDYGEPSSIQLVSHLVDILIAEKRAQFRSRLHVDIEFSMRPSSYGLFARVQPALFNRVLSNLINNAVESLGDTGQVTVFLTGSDGAVRLIIEDTGKGIPPDILPKLMKEGATFGKQGGVGLGLSFARRAMKLWGGEIEIDSEVGKGTKVSLTIPRTEAPKWFTAKIVIPEGTNVVVLDDDVSIHRVWETRVTSIPDLSEKVKTIHFSAADELRNYCRNQSTINSIYLIDYELRGSTSDGLALIRELGIQNQSILVTSHYGERIFNDCNALGLKLIPKAMAGAVPLEFLPKSSIRFDAVLVNEDPVVRTSWWVSAKRFGKNIKVFPDLSAFLSDSDSVDPKTPIYFGSVAEPSSHEQTVTALSGFENIVFTPLAGTEGVDQKNPPPWET